MHPLANRNLLLLFGCQVIFVAGTVVLVTIGGIVGHSLAPSPSLATLPVALMVVGTALATIPAALSMQRWGRKSGFLLGASLAALGAFAADRALAGESFVLFCAATGSIGASLGFSQHFRFAAAESVNSDKVSFAVSFILMGSILGAFAAPEIIAFSAAAEDGSPYGLVFRITIIGYALAAVLFLGLQKSNVDNEISAEPARGTATIVRQPIFVVAALAGMVGQGAMTYVMTATPISMNISDGFSILETSEVIRAHVIAMYLPSLVTPFLIARFGLITMMAAGVVITALTLGIGMLGHHLLHYWWALVLLGVGWNFLFVSGTTMLTQAYRPSERFRAQAVNDFGVFGVSAAASLLAGSVLHALGWTMLLISVIPALTIMALSLLWLARRQTASQPAA
ncbi:MAG: MFS transporter [Pseudomonadota bacterium]